MPRILLLPLLLLTLAVPLSAAAATAPPTPRDGTLITYQGAEAKASLPLRSDRLPGAPADFRAFVKSELHAIWRDLGHSQACKTSPLITVDALRTDGFALGTVSSRPRRDCAGAGGGYVAFWAVRHGAWKEVIGTQEVVKCAKLERFDIPSEIGVHECYQGDEVVPYDHP